MVRSVNDKEQLQVKVKHANLRENCFIDLSKAFYFQLEIFLLGTVVHYYLYHEGEWDMRYNIQ